MFLRLEMLRIRVQVQGREEQSLSKSLGEPWWGGGCLLRSVVLCARIPGLGSLGQVSDHHSLCRCGQVDVRGVNCKVLCKVLLSAAEVWAGSSLGLAELGYTRR